LTHNVVFERGLILAFRKYLRGGASPSYGRTSPLCGLDALDSAIGGDGFATPDPQRFLEAVSRATCTTYPAVGAGEDLRFEGGGIVGAALDTHNGVVHAVAFPSADVIRPNVKRRFGVH